MNIVIVGAKGIIGNALYRLFSDRFGSCVGLTTANEPSLTSVNYDASSLQPYIDRADVVAYCIGVSKFAECENDPEKSYYLNLQLPIDLLKLYCREKIFVYFSSPIALYNFDTARRPLYAEHKKRAEENLNGDKVIILRPAKIIESLDIVKKWKDQLQQGEKIIAFKDQYIAPINTGLVADSLLKLIENKWVGAYNLSARDRISYANIAARLCRQIGGNQQHITGTEAKHDNPFYFEQDVLDCSAAEAAIGYIPPVSADIFNQYLQTLA